MDRTEDSAADELRAEFAELRKNMEELRENVQLEAAKHERLRDLLRDARNPLLCLVELDRILDLNHPDAQLIVQRAQRVLKAIDQEMPDVEE